MDGQKGNDLAYRRRRRVVSVVSIVILVGFMVAVTVFVGRPLLRMVGEPEQFRQWIASHGFGGKLAFLGMVALQVVIALIPGEPLELGAGYAFGFWEGTLLCLLGCAVASALVFLFVRKCGVWLAEAFVSREKINSVKWLSTSKKRNTLTFILFLIPGTPKDVLTYFVGLTDMKMGTFLLISTVARIPSVITSTLSGNALGLKDYTQAILVFGLTGLMALGGILYYRKFSAKHSQPQEPAPKADAALEPQPEPAPDDDPTEQTK